MSSDLNIVLAPSPLLANETFTSRSYSSNQLNQFNITCSSDVAYSLELYQASNGVNFDAVDTQQAVVDAVSNSYIANLRADIKGLYFYVRVVNSTNPQSWLRININVSATGSSTFIADATADLNMNGFNINEANDVTCNKLLTANIQASPSDTISVDGNLDMTGSNITGVNQLDVDGNIAITNLLGEASLPIITNVTSINGNPVQYLTAGAGIDISNQVISTIGNPNIGLTYRSYYVNDGESDLQTALTASAGLQAVNIYMSGGSFGGANIIISGQTNQNIIAPNNVGSICELGSSGSPRNVTITNSTRICINNLQINGSLTLSGTGGSHKIMRCNFKDGGVVLDGLAGGFVVFENCEWSNSSVLHLSTFAGIVYYINCNFNGAIWSANQPLATQLILNNSSGLTSFTNPAKRTLVGLCALTNGVANINTNNLNTSTINGSAYPPTGSTFDPENQNPVKYGSTGVGTGAGTRSVSIGDRSGSNPTYPNGTDSIAIGTESNSRAGGTIAIGKFALATASQGIAIGEEAESKGLSVAIGYQAVSNAGNSSTGVYIGNQVGTGASGLCQDSTLIGDKCGYNTQSIQESVVVGNSSWISSNCINVVAVGRNCGQNSTGSKVISIGNNSSLGIDNQNIVIGSSSFNNGDPTKGCVILGHDICNFTAVSNNSLIINNSQGSFEPPAVENAVYVSNVRSTGLDYTSYPNASNAITYNDTTKEISKQRVFISRGQLDGGSPNAIVTFTDSMFDDASKVVVLYNKQSFNHPNNGIVSFTIGGGNLTFSSTHNGDNDFIGVQAYRITL